MIFALEYATAEAARRTEFLGQAVESILEGYGAGNCNPESVAFWAFYDKPAATLTGDWTILRVFINGEQDDLSIYEIIAAIMKVTDEPGGELVVYGKSVGRWTTT